MMAGNPSNWWSNMLPPPQYVLGSSSLPLNSMAENHHNPEPNSQSWSQLLLGGLQEGDDEDRLVLNNHYQPKKLENLEGRILIPFPRFPFGDVLKEEVSQNSNNFSFFKDEELSKNSQTKTTTTSSSCASPRSSVTSCLSRNSILDFSYNKIDPTNHGHDYNHSSECDSTATGGVNKKARVQPTSGQPPLKARKEKVGDRITALHQLVSPFGKTDTASVLSEAIGYVRFLQAQIEALISPYLGSSSKTMKRDQFLLNDNSLKRKLAPSQENEEEPKDLRSRGLCLVPVSCTQLVESDINGADYWAQAYNGSF